ncbi:hypothetical protein [Methylobacterium sp. sgz302541]|uniref:hypothetical protein n=1 Tax=unclassified Methylobacterium TaxID=2615210 RepID=UPI003D3441BE
MRLICAVALMILFDTAAAQAVDYRWTVGTGQGNVEASIRNREGGRFILFCGSGTPDRRGGIIVEGPASQAPKGKPVDVQVVVDGRNFAFSVTDGYGPTTVRGERFALANLASALIASKAESFAVEYPGLGRSEKFSLLNVSDAVKEGRTTIVAPCL